METQNPDVIILNDVVNRYTLYRYCAPYMLAHSLRAEGYNVKVIDWFTKLPGHGMDVIKQWISPNLKTIMFSSTFLMIRTLKADEYDRPVQNYNERNLDMVSKSMWFQSQEEMLDWFEDLQSTMRAKAPDSKMVLGGGACVRVAHFIPELAKYIDLVVSGYGEHAVIKIMRNEPIDSITYNGFEFWRVPDKLQPLRSYPFYLYKEDLYTPDDVGILTYSRGCLFRCKYCSFDNGRSASLTEDELRDVLLRNYDNTGITRYNIMDYCINDHYEKITTLLKVSKSLPFKLEWTSFVRPDLYKKYPEMLDMMLESGGVGLFYGIETLHNKAGALCGKGGDRMALMELLIKMKERCRDDAYTIGSFIIGLPGEPEESIRASMEFTTTQKPFHYALYGSLVLPHPDFVKATDHLTFQNNGYSMFAKNPERYGLSFYENYDYIGAWEHEHMTYNEANQMCAEHITAENKRAFIAKSAHYDINTLLNAGYTKKEVLDICNNGKEEDFIRMRMHGNRFSKKIIGEYLYKLRTGL